VSTTPVNLLFKKKHNNNNNKQQQHDDYNPLAGGKKKALDYLIQKISYLQSIQKLYN
jgi:hypothetical protein